MNLQWLAGPAIAGVSILQATGIEWSCKSHGRHNNNEYCNVCITTSLKEEHGSNRNGNMINWTGTRKLFICEAGRRGGRRLLLISWSTIDNHKSCGWLADRNVLCTFPEILDPEVIKGQIGSGIQVPYPCSSRSSPYRQYQTWGHLCRAWTSAT
jgi:hypothetical protein